MSVALKDIKNLDFSKFTDLDLAYIAGIVDGEGCIQITKVKIKRKKRKIQYKLQLRVSNTDLRLIKYLNEKMPAYIMNGNKNKPAKSRNQFVWHTNGSYASKILERIYPYLICKKEQAKIAMDFQKTFEKYYGVFGLPKEIINLREQCIKSCTLLKNKEFHCVNNIDLKNASDLDLAYFAGVVDGEGCIEIQKCKIRNREINTPYRMRFRINNTDANLIAHLNSIFPGYLGKKFDISGIRRNQFIWNGINRNYKEMLEKLYPYLICKKEQAKIAMDFLKTYDTYYGIFGTPKDVLEYREKCYLECKNLKKLEYQRL